jgi:membrane protein DedA with SNARE-associated domain
VWNSLADTHSLINQYGYIAVLVGTFLEGETILLLAGVAAQIGVLDLPLVVLCGFVGSTLGDQLYFSIGRWRGPKLLIRFPAWTPRVQKIKGLIDRFETWIVLFFRFFYGLRNITPFALGILGVSRLKFTVLNIIGGLIWALSFGFLGFYFGSLIEKLWAGPFKQFMIVVSAAVLLLLGWVYFRSRQSKD